MNWSYDFRFSVCLSISNTLFSESTFWTVFLNILHEAREPEGLQSDTLIFRNFFPLFFAEISKMGQKYGFLEFLEHFVVH